MRRKFGPAPKPAHLKKSKELRVAMTEADYASVEARAGDLPLAEFARRAIEVYGSTAIHLGIVAGRERVLHLEYGTPLLIDDDGGYNLDALSADTLYEVILKMATLMGARK